MKHGIRCAAAALALLAVTAAGAVKFDMVSVRSDGTPPPGGFSDAGDQPAISPDGRYVVFVATADSLVTPSATGGLRQVYLRDRVAGTTEIVSVNAAGQSGDSTSSRVSVSDDGCRVLFHSHSSNLVAGDVVGTQDIYLRNRCVQPFTTTAVSVNAGGALANAQSYEGRISGNGSKVYFTSYATDLVPGLVGAGSSCLYVRNLDALTTSAISAVAGKCTEASSPSPSQNGTRVAFWAQYEPGTSNRTNDVWQIWVHETTSGAFVIASSNAAGQPQYRTDPANPSRPGEGVSTVTEPALSSEGSYVAFRSRAFGLTSKDGGGTSHVFLKELSTGTIVNVSVDSGGNLGNADSSGSGSGSRPGLSRNAGTVTFLTNATNLAVETGGSWPNVVAHNPRTGVTVGFTASQTLNSSPNVSDDGTTIVAASNYALDTAFTTRGLFSFPVFLSRIEDRVRFYYQSILRRAVDAGGLSFWSGEAARMDRLGVSINEVAFALAGTFFTSAEYAAFNRDNSGFVSDLYTTFFNRAPDDAGLAYWKTQLDQGLPREVALAAFTFSAEFSNYNRSIFGSTSVRAEINTVTDFYRGLISRLPDDGGFAYWLTRFRTAQCSGGNAVNAEVESISSLFAGSQEYANRARGNSQYVGDLYNAFLRRGGDLAGVQFWIDQITSGARSRGNVRQAFVASEEFQSRVAAIIAQGCLR